jgi:hypothetical protein
MPRLHRKAGSSSMPWMVEEAGSSSMPWMVEEAGPSSMPWMTKKRPILDAVDDEEEAHPRWRE